MRRMRKVFDRREKGPEGNPGPRVLRGYYVRSGTATFRRGGFWTPFWPVGHRFM